MQPETNLPILEFRNVTVGFAADPVLQNVSFSLARGEMICITGASASGKSVLLRLAGGLLRPDSGDVLVEGRSICRLSEEELLALRGDMMGIVFQGEALFTGLSVYENTAYRMADRGRDEAEIQRSVREILRFVGLDGEQNRLPEELSGGMRRRLEFARALVGWPRIMLYDEPTEGLDPLNATQLLDLIINARDVYGASSLLVTKNLEEIPYLASHRAVRSTREMLSIRDECSPVVSVMVLERGRVAFFGSPAEFATNLSPAVTYLTQAENGTVLSEFYTPDPWRKRKVPVRIT